MRNPLSRRYPRELRHNIGKYLGIFFMMLVATAFTSGYLLAASSIETIINEMDETYDIEDGRFVCDFEPDDEALEAVEALGVTLYEDYYKEVNLALVQSGDRRDDITARVYCNRTEINLPAYAEGRAPERAGEVALDRVFMENHDLVLGGTVILDGHELEIVGICTLPDYQAMFQDNNSFMFNAITFTVLQVAPDQYEELDVGAEVFNYSFKFNDPSLDLVQRTDLEEDMIDALSDNDASLAEFIDAEDNQGIGYAIDDVTGDQVMWTVLLFVLVIIMAFVFVVLTSATIEQESAVIGTMLASGWRKGELIRHYMFLPAIIGAIAVTAGLIVGVTLFSDPMKNLYYHSYSLPPYHVIWNMRVVLITTVIPYVMLVGITFVGLARKLRFTPLQFLRHEAAGKRRNSRLRLPERLAYATRFRLRVLLRNASHFVTLFFGIMFASLLLLFGMCMVPVVDNYAQELRETVVAPHQYVLKAPVELEGTDEEVEMYAAALRLAEDHERMEANREAIDALERLEDDEQLMDALERIMDDDELVAVLDRLQDKQDILDAAERLESEPELVAAAQRLQSKQDLLAAAQRLQSKPELLAAAQRLQSRQDLVAAAQRLQSKPELVAAAQRLQESPEMVAAAQRLQGKESLVAAAQRLQGKEELVVAAQRLAGKPDVVAAAQRIADGTATEEDYALMAVQDEQTLSDLELVATMDDQTRADIATVSGMDDQTRRDMELVATMDDQTRADLELVSGMDAQTREDIALVATMDAQTKADMELISNMDAQTRRDMELVASMDDQTRADIAIVSGMDDQARRDMELVSSMDDQTRADLEYLSNLDGQKRDDLELLMNIDDKTQADIDLVRDMDEDLLDDLRLASDIDEDAHIVNTQKNSAQAIAGAEKYAMQSVEVERLFGGTYETITVYGIQPDSSFWEDYGIETGTVIAGRGFIEKTKGEVGEPIELFDRRKGESYTVVITGEASTRADTSIYMSIDDYNELFGNDPDYFNAYASDRELNIDGRYVASTIEPSDMDRITAQIQESMGRIMFMMMLMAVPIYLILVYLLTKTVIDRSARSISYMKVFGYQNREVNGLYVKPITYAVLFSLVASLPLIFGLLAVLIKVIFMSYAGNFPLSIPPSRYLVLIVVGMAAYALVAFLHVRRIKKVPLSVALKVQE